MQEQEVTYAINAALDESSPASAPLILVTLEGSDGFSLALPYDLEGVDWFAKKFTNLRFQMWWRMAEYLAVSNSNLEKTHLIKKGDYEIPSHPLVGSPTDPAICGAKPSHPVWKVRTDENEGFEAAYYLWLNTEPLRHEPKPDVVSNYCKRCYAAWQKAGSRLVVTEEKEG
jgi:hypothetical protein